MSSPRTSELFRGPPQWTDIWKGFSAMFGAYVFAALATRGFAPHTSQLSLEPAVATRDKGGT